MVLLDLTIVVLGITPMLVEGGQLHGFLNSGDVDCSHWIAVSQALSGGSSCGILGDGGV